MTRRREPSPTSARFHSTSWTQVRQAAEGDDTACREALGALCVDYWPPLYAWLRRDGHPPDRAQDLTQGFFARLLEREDLASLTPERGRFRSYLLRSLKNYVINDRQREAAEKRGGGRAVLSLDFEDAERSFVDEPADESPPDLFFERRWALTTMDRALQRLQEHERQRGREALFERLEEFLTTSPEPGRLATLAAELGREPTAVKVALHRLRRSFGERIREELARTTDPGEVETELEELLAALSPHRSG